MEVDLCTTVEGRTDTAGCTRPRPRPRRLAAVSLAEATDMVATMVVDTVDTPHRTTEAAWEWVTQHMELLGSGPGRRLSSRTNSLAPTVADSRTPLPGLVRTEVDMAAESAVMTTCPSVVVQAVLSMADLAVMTVWTALVVPGVRLE